ncbi:MAG TPA: FliG C-terminal domain-containing protein [Spirochaetota bacterium]|nr:FliG C-terminal domain-containing protein [Spirochaetota bacterium]
MSYSPEFFDRIRCHRSKKKQCVELIASIITLSERARRMGLLALEDDLDAIKDPMMKKGLLLVVDGTDPAIVHQVLSAFMLSCYSRGINLLKAVIILQGVLGIQAGDNTRLIAEKLSVFLGKDIDLWETYWNDNVNARTGVGGVHGAEGEGHAHRAGDVNSEVEGIDFEKLADMADRFIQKILREVDTRDLAMALKGASAKMQDKIFGNMSNRAAILLKEDMDYMGPVRMDDVICCQERILTIACRLAEAGEIIFPDGSELVE